MYALYEPTWTVVKVVKVVNVVNVVEVAEIGQPKPCYLDSDTKSPSNSFRPKDEWKNDHSKQFQISPRLPIWG